MPTLVLAADAPWVANEVRAALATEPWEIIEVEDPRQVTGALTESGATAAIIDMQVGSMGGMALAREIRHSLDPRPHLVLLLDRSADSFLAKRAGVDAAVLKPIEAAELRMALSDAL